jgi:hypothetical protein
MTKAYSFFGIWSFFGHSDLVLRHSISDLCQRTPPPCLRWGEPPMAPVISSLIMVSCETEDSSKIQSQIAIAH